ncbi:MAG: SlyX family protein [Gammaproteobacteria bacterium]
MKTIETRLVDLEIRLTHQEATLQQLSDAMVAQQKLIDGLTATIVALKQQMAAQAQFNVANAAEETQPPHY